MRYLGYSNEQYHELDEAQVIGQIPDNQGVTPPPDLEALLRMGFLAKYDRDYKMRLGIVPGDIE